MSQFDAKNEVEDKKGKDNDEKKKDKNTNQDKIEKNDSNFSTAMLLMVSKQLTMKELAMINVSSRDRANLDISLC